MALAQELDQDVDQVQESENQIAPDEPFVQDDPSVGQGGETIADDSLSQTPAQVTEPQPDFIGARDLFAQHGLDASQFPDDEAAMRFLFDTAKQHQQILPYYQQVVPHWGTFQQYLATQQHGAAQQQPQPAPAQQQPAPKPYWEPMPELKPEALRMVAVDQSTGMLVVKPEFRGMVAPDLPQRVQAYLDAKRQREEKLLNNPIEAIWEGGGGLQERIQKQYEQREQDLLKRVDAHLNALLYMRDNAQQIYAHDQTGQPLRDPSTGQPAMTPYGQAFSYYLQEADRLGIKDYAAREHYGRQLAQAYVSQQQPPQPVSQARPAAAPAPQPRPNFLQTAARKPSRAGTESEPVPDSGLNLRESLIQNLRNAGHLSADFN